MPVHLRAALHLKRTGGSFVRGARAGYPHPRLGGRIAVVGPDPLRVLLFGGEYAVGYNTSSRARALDGAIADVLHELTGRGVIVENRASPDVRLADLTGSRGAIGAHTFDLAVWAPTFGEAARHLGLRPWRRALTDLVRLVRTTGDAGLILLTIPQLLGPQPLAMLARARGGAIRQVIDSVADASDRVLAVEPPAIEMRMLANVDGPATYRAVAERMAPAMLHLLGLRTLAGAGSA